MPLTVEVEHEWTKERRTLDVETIVSPWRILVRWPLQGLYVLDLDTNTMRASSTSARNKNPFCLWRVADIEALRKEVLALAEPDKTETQLDELMHRHWQSMPRGR